MFKFRSREKPLHTPTLELPLVEATDFVGCRTINRYDWPKSFWPNHFESKPFKSFEVLNFAARASRYQWENPFYFETFESYSKSTSQSGRASDQHTCVCYQLMHIQCTSNAHPRMLTMMCPLKPFPSNQPILQHPAAIGRSLERPKRHSLPGDDPVKICRASTNDSFNNGSNRKKGPRCQKVKVSERLRKIKELHVQV